jgi:hypothetical protein
MPDMECAAAAGIPYLLIFSSGYAIAREGVSIIVVYSLSAKN